MLNLTDTDILGFNGDTSELVHLMRTAEQGSRFYTWDNETDAYLGAGADEADYTIWNIALKDGSALWLLACNERPSVLMILETTEEAVQCH